MTEQELREYCAKYNDTIYVRAQTGGKWGNVKLSELSMDEREKLIIRWNEMGHTPLRVRA